MGNKGVFTTSIVIAIFLVATIIIGGLYSDMKNAFLTVNRDKDLVKDFINERNGLERVYGMIIDNIWLELIDVDNKNITFSDLDKEYNLNVLYRLVEEVEENLYAYLEIKINDGKGDKFITFYKGPNDTILGYK